MDKNKIKERIEEIEFNNNGMSNLNGTDVKVSNVRISKRLVTADVKLIFDDEGKTENYSDCEYPLELFKGLI